MTHRLRSVIALAVMAALTAACASGEDTAAVDTTAPGATTPTTVAAEGGNQPEIEGDLLTPQEDVPTTTAASPGEEPPTVTPNEYGAPEPGSYQYRFDDEDELLAVFDHDAPRHRDLRQTFIFQREERREAELVRWQADGLWVLSQQLQAGAQPSPRCDWQPAYLEVPRPLQVGREWTIDSRCQEGSNTRHVQGTAQITGTETIQIQGAAYEVFVIERTTDTTVSDENGVALATQRRRSTDRWAVSVGLLARSDATLATTVQHVEARPVDELRQLVDPTPVR